MMISLAVAVAAAAFMWMVLRGVMVCIDPRADIRLASGWYMLPTALCTLALLVAMILWVLA